MPRHVWAKVYCDLLRHPKIIGRPDSDVRLFLGLILYAKEYAPDTGMVALPAEAMRTQFGIKAPLAIVKAGLAYLVSAGVLVTEGEHVRIRDFAARQKDDSSAARTRAWRERQRDGESSSHQASLPRHASSPASPEVEEEEDLNPVVVARGGVRGGEFTACESVDNSQSQERNTACEQQATPLKAEILELVEGLRQQREKAQKAAESADKTGPEAPR